MLKLLLGRAGTGKTTEILGTMAREGERRPQLLIVPEQHSHDAERQLCAVGGNGVSLCAEVLTFTRLASRVFSVGGGCRSLCWPPAGGCCGWMERWMRLRTG